MTVELMTKEVTVTSTEVTGVKATGAYRGQNLVIRPSNLGDGTLVIEFDKEYGKDNILSMDKDTLKEVAEEVLDYLV